MVGENDIGGFTQKGNAREHVVAHLAVRAHDHFFGVVQRPWLAENFVGDGHFADVVKTSGASQHGEIRERNGDTLCNGNGTGGDTLTMGLIWSGYRQVVTSLWKAVLIFVGRGMVRS
jgi:hypothetical protein